jgi:hypothetical protein
MAAVEEADAEFQCLLRGTYVATGAPECEEGRAPYPTR